VVALGGVGLLLYLARQSPPPTGPAPSSIANGDSKRRELSVADLVAALKAGDAAERAAAALALGERGEGAPEAWPALAEALRDRDADVRSAAAQALGKAGRPAHVTAMALGRTEQDDRDAEVRRAAREALAAVGRPVPKDDVPLWMDALKDERAPYRVLAARSLYWAGPDAAPAAAALGHALETDGDARVREAALLALEKFGPAAKPATRGIVKALADPDPDARARAARLLGAVGPEGDEAIDELCRLLKDDKDLTVRVQATYALGRAGQAVRDRAAGALRTACADESPPIRVEAALSLWGLTTEPEPSLLVLTAALDGSDPPVRARALQGLALMGPASAPALPAVVQALRGAREPAVRARAAVVALRLGRGARLAYPSLHYATGDEDPDVKQTASAAMRAAGKPTVADVKELVEAMKGSKYVWWRVNAANALWLIGGDARATAVPALSAALADDRSEDVRLAAVGALGQMGPDAAQAVDQLAKALSDTDSAAVRTLAAIVLRDLGPAGKKAVPALAKALRGDRDKDVRLAALAALSQMGAEGAKEWKAVADALHDTESPAVRAAAAEVLGAFGSDAKEAVPDLGRALRDDGEKEVRLSAAAALGRMGPDAAGAVGALAGALGDKEPAAVRVAAAEVLGGLGAKATEAVPALGKALGQPEPEVRLAVARALGLIAGVERTPALAEKLKDVVGDLRDALARGKEVPQRVALCDALEEVGEDAKPALPVLESLLKADNGEVRLHAALAHWGIRRDSGPVLPVLKDLLKGKDAALRLDTAVALKYMAADLKGKAVNVADGLNAALADDDMRVRAAAAFALWAMRGDLPAEKFADVVPALLDALEDGDEAARLSVAQGLLATPDIETKARLAYPLLMRLSEEDAGEEAQAALRAAANRLTRPTERDVSTLLLRLQDKKSARSRALAAECLRMIRPDNKDVVEALASVVSDDDRTEPRVQAAAALGAIGSPAAVGVPALVAALKGEKASLRAAAAVALGQIGAGAKAAADPLAARFKDKSEEEEVRKAAGDALKKIDPKAATAAGVP
jgi:HEAT repeat protein